MTFRLSACAACLAAASLVAVGCAEPKSPAQKSADGASSGAQGDAKEGHGHDHGDHDEHDAEEGHSHVRDKMMITDAGPYHVLLTAHLSPEGNELDIFFETTDTKNPQPQAVPVESFEAQATAGEGESQALNFAPAPADERPAGEAPGVCSHFVAKAPWLKPDQKLLVVAKFTIEGTEHVARWRDFHPKTFAHHVE